MKKQKRKTRERRLRQKAARKKPADIAIRRSSGRIERFDRERLAATTSRSGVPFMMARDIAKKVTRQIKSEAKGRKKATVTGGRIRRIVASEVHIRNPRMASSNRLGTRSRPSGYHARLPKATVGKANTDQHGAYRADRDSVMHDKSKRRSAAR
jgi:hypothetical protein